MFHMGKVIRSRKVIRDVTYKWIPFLFVVLTVMVSAALLSTSGRPPRGIVVTFSVFAGLLVVFFLSCHLTLYCSRIKREMDTEGANGDNGNADPGLQLDGNTPTNFIPNTNINTTNNANANTQTEPQERDFTGRYHLGSDEQHRHSQFHPDRHTGRYAATRSPAGQHDVHMPNLVAGYDAYQPQSRDEPATTVYKHKSRPTLGQRHLETSIRRSSAAPDPLRLNQQPQEEGSAQQQPRPNLGLEGLSVRRPRSRYTSGGDYKTLHSERSTRSQTKVADPPRRGPENSHREALRDTALPYMLQHGVPDDQPRSSGISLAEQQETELFRKQAQDRRRGASAHADTPGFDQAERRGVPAETPNDVQAHFALLGGPGVWGLVSRFLSDMKPHAHRVRRKSAGDCLDIIPLEPDGTADVVTLRDIGRKAVQVYPSEPEVERIRSQKAIVQRTAFRDSNDSGYYSAGSNQRQTSLPQPPVPSTAPSTGVSSMSGSSAASACPPPSNELSLSSQLSTASGQHSPHRHSVSSMSSGWMGSNWRGSMGDEGSIEVTMVRPLRNMRAKPRGRSKTF